MVGKRGGIHRGTQAGWGLKLLHRGIHRFGLRRDFTGLSRVFKRGFGGRLLLRRRFGSIFQGERSFKVKKWFLAKSRGILGRLLRGIQQGFTPVFKLGFNKLRVIALEFKF
jgi:hypothetical protein